MSLGDPHLNVISWNVLRKVGASVQDVAALIRSERPDLLLLQEATADFDRLCDLVGGHYARAPLPDRIHGLAMWSPTGWRHAPTVTVLPRGSLIKRVCQIVSIGEWGIANVHLSHGQRLNRLQLRRIADRLPPRGAILGDYNLVGPAMLPGFRDAGPRGATHRMGDLVPIRIDRCLVRGLVCDNPRILPRRSSDHCPIAVRLSAAAFAPTRDDVRYRVVAAAIRHRAAALARFSRRGRPDGVERPGGSR